MKCVEFREVANLYALDALDAEERGAAEAHLKESIDHDGCFEAVAEAFDAIATLPDSVTGPDGEPIEVPAGQWAAIEARLDALPEAERAPRPRAARRPAASTAPVKARPAVSPARRPLWRRRGAVAGAWAASVAATAGIVALAAGGLFGTCAGPERVVRGRDGDEAAVIVHRRPSGPLEREAPFMVADTTALATLVPAPGVAVRGRAWIGADGRVLAVVTGVDLSDERSLWLWVLADGRSAGAPAPFGILSAADMATWFAVRESGAAGNVVVSMEKGAPGDAPAKVVLSSAGLAEGP